MVAGTAMKLLVLISLGIFGLKASKFSYSGRSWNEEADGVDLLSIFLGLLASEFSHGGCS
jgi:hypothetical protein